MFRYEGKDGALEYRWKLPAKEDPSLLGEIALHARIEGDTPVALNLASGAGIAWDRAAAPVASVSYLKNGLLSLTRIYRFGQEEAQVKIEGRLVGKSLVLAVACDRPWVQALNGGVWGPVLRRIDIPVPYYSGHIRYLPAENLFVTARADFLSSRATALEGGHAEPDTLTDGSRNNLQERLVYTAAWHLAETLPNIPNPPSPYIGDLSSRIMLDIWGGRYTNIAAKLETLHDYGITGAAVIVHDWQRSGYDNALPDHVPAAADKGGDTGMKALVSTAERLGYRISLHENYVDYYPNYDRFNEKDIALDNRGRRQNAWYNPGTKIQSFAVKPNAILALAETQSPEIARRYGPNADYLDVHSAVPPWFHVDRRAGEEGAGEFRRVWDIHRQLWRYERETYHGPVFGEGANHWYWSGALDGVEAQFGAGWPGSAGRSAPLAVDFDLLKIHPLQFNHGMGYYERWWSERSWSGLPPMRVLDQYRMQEAAYGHMGFLGASTWSSVGLAWLEHHLMTPVTTRIAAASPAKIEYQVDGRWVDTTAAAKAGDFRRVRITYDNGLVLTANGELRTDAAASSRNRGSEPRGHGIGAENPAGIRLVGGRRRRARGNDAPIR